MSTIKLYRNCKITEEKNFQVDEVYDYLGSFSGGDVKVFNNCQYIKQGLDAEVKVTLDQTYLDKQWTNMFNYCSIEMDNGGLDNTYYYFIREKKWISKDAIRLVLRLDVLNTFNGQYKLTDKTTIQREHKDRFVKEEDHSDIIRTYLNSEDWSWNLTPATATQRKGNATFQLPDTFKGRKVNVVIELISGTGADFYSHFWDNETCELTIEAIKLGYPRPSIPTGEIRILVETKISDKLVRIVDPQSEGFENVLWNQNKDELLQEILYPNTENEHPMGESSWYLTYKTNTDYNSNNPDDFIYDNAINAFITSDENGLTVPTITDTTIGIRSLWTGDNSIAEEHWNKGVILSFPVGAEGKHMPNSFPEFDESKLSVEPKEITFRIEAEGKEPIEQKIGTYYVNSTNHRLRQRVLVLQEKYDAGSGTLHRNLYLLDLKRDNYVRERTGSIIRLCDLRDYADGTITFINTSRIIFYTTTANEVVTQDKNLYDAYVRNPGSTTYPYAGGGEPTTGGELMNFNFTNRTDQKLVKIINVPYSPVDIGVNTLLYDNNEKQLTLNTSEFQYDAGLTHQVVLEAWPDGDDEPYTPLTDMIIDVPTIIGNENRNDINESKLYHSDFYQVKCVYDSFSYIFRNELLDTTYIKDIYDDNRLYVDYCVSNSVSSAFGINFTYSFPLKKNYQDYNVMVVNRNLEMPIYNNYYLNYLRSGALSADKKANQAKEVASGIGLGASIAATIATTISTIATEGATAPLLVASVGGLATSLTGTITNATQADRALQQKMEQAKNQAASVQGSDDIGLLKWYGNQNHCKLVRYELSENTKERVADLFYYCGYKCDYQNVPNTTSRYWFNFIQCDPVFDVDRYTVKMGKECQDELTSKYQQGITVLHRNNGTYDFDQVKENWETWLIQ